MTNLEKYISERSITSESGCVEWSLSKDKDGYGKAKIAGASLVAHRLAWEAKNGPIPRGMLVCHSCDNPSCVNEKHLFLGTPQDNMTDKMIKGRYKGGPIYWKSKPIHKRNVRMEV